MALGLTRRGVLAVGAALVAAPLAAGDAPLTVFAAASLKTALDRIAAEWDGETAISYASSGVLARQIAQGAPADIFISANPDWMDWLQERGGIRAGSRRTLLSNRLVIVSAQKIEPPASIEDLPGIRPGERMAIGMTRSVPAGIYGRAALEDLGLWDAMKDRLAEVDNVRLALVLAARGEVPFALVYASDAAASDAVHILAEIPAESHPPILYPAAVTADAQHPAAQAFLDHIAGAEAQARFLETGFLLPPSVQ